MVASIRPQNSRNACGGHKAIRCGTLAHDPHAPLIIDIAGTTLTKTDEQRLRHPLVGGVICLVAIGATASN